jgi:hypothetical protein
MDESMSPYQHENIETYTHTIASQEDLLVDNLMEDKEFIESNLMHAINGYVYGNGPGFEVVKNSKVRWYIWAFGNEVSLHSLHWHGQGAAYLLPCSRVLA